MEYLFGLSDAEKTALWNDDILPMWRKANLMAAKTTNSTSETSHPAPKQTMSAAQGAGSGDGNSYLTLRKPLVQCVPQSLSPIQAISESLQGSKRGKKLTRSFLEKVCITGIPSGLRKEVWPALIGNQLRITPDLFDVLVSSAEENRYIFGDDTDSNGDARTITSHDDADQYDNSDKDDYSQQEDKMGYSKEENYGSGSCARTDANVSYSSDEVTISSELEEEQINFEQSSSLCELAKKSEPDQLHREGLGSNTQVKSCHQNVGVSYCDELDTIDLYSDSPLPMDAVTDASLPTSSAQARTGEDAQRKNSHDIGPSEGSLGQELSLPSRRQKKVFTQIEMDLERTFSELYLSQEDNKNSFRESLRLILEAYALFRPTAGYLQGMSYVAFILLRFVPREIAFSSFCNVFEQHPFISLLSTNNDMQVKVHNSLFNALLAECAPSVSQHFAKVLFSDPAIFLLDWFLTFFATALPFNLTARVWDVFLLRDSTTGKESFIWESAMVIFRLLKDELCVLDFDATLLFLRSISKGHRNLTPETFFGELQQIRITVPQLHRLRGQT